MKTLRRVLSLPFALLQLIVIVIGYTMTKLFIDGMKDHVWWPLVQAQRIVAGDPRWIIEDLIHLGKQPRTPADIATAEASDDLTKVICTCTDPKCAAANGPIYVPKTAVRPALVQAAPPTDVP